MADTPTTVFAAGGKKKARIEIIPLIDVIFFLLATFVLFTLSLNKIQSLEAKLPSTVVKKEPNPILPMIIQASEGDVVYIDQKPRSITEVYSSVAQYKDVQEKAGKAARVLITGDESAKYGNFIKILDYVKSAGIQEGDYSLETDYRGTGK